MRERIGAVRRPYFGWTLVTGVGLAQITSWGILYYAFAVMLTPMEAELGWSRSVMTTAFSIALLCSGIAAVPVGRYMDRVGPRWMMPIGSVAGVLLVLAWAEIDSLATYYLVFAAIGLVQATVLYEPAFWLVTTWFRRLRSRALTWLTVLGGLASVIWVPVTERLIAEHGWRDALQILAVALAIGTIPIHLLLLRNRPGDLGLAPDGAPLPPVASDGSSSPEATPERSVSARDAVRGIAFRWVSVAFFLTTLAGAALSLHIVPYLIEEGFSPEFAASMLALLGLLSLPGRIIFAPLRAWLPGQRATLVVVICQPIGMLALVLLDGEAGVFVFVLLFGLGSRALTVARAAVLADLYGPAQYGAISGTLAGVLTIARTLAPGGIGVLYDLFGGYDPVFLLLAAGGAVAAVAVVMLDRVAGPDETPAAA